MNEDQDPEDLAPDADERGDEKLPTGLESYKHDGEIVPDNVDQPPKETK